ncbi:hypothetical protein QIE_2676 [Clostridioides difficile DA00062]|nr:hypothetical protein QIE_2676 [Clostridioides difficile DA00062]
MKIFTPALSTFLTSSNNFAKSADNIDGANLIMFLIPPTIILSYFM